MQDACTPVTAASYTKSALPASSIQYRATILAIISKNEYKKKHSLPTSALFL